MRGRDGVYLTFLTGYSKILFGMCSCVLSNKAALKQQQPHKPCASYIKTHGQSIHALIITRNWNDKQRRCAKDQHKNETLWRTLILWFVLRFIRFLYFACVFVTIKFIQFCKRTHIYISFFLIEHDKVWKKIYCRTFMNHLDNAMIDIKSIIQLITKIVLGME